MNSRIIANGILRAVAVLVGILIFLYFLYKIQSVLVYLVIATVLSLIATPVQRFLKNKLKFPNVLAVVITMSMFLLVIMGIISMFIPLIKEQGHNISLLNTEELRRRIFNLFHEIDLYFAARRINLFGELKNIDLTSNIASIPSLLNSFVGVVGTFSVGLFSVLFITFFFLKDTKMLHNVFVLVTPDKNEAKILNSLKTINDLLSRYFIGLIIQISILFTIYSITLLIFNIKSAVVIAFLCALLNLIPYIGPLIGGVLMILLTMTSSLEYDFQTHILPVTLYVLFGYIIAQLIDNFFSQPIIFSKSVKSHPLEIFLIIVIGGLLFGITGMIFAVPSYTVIKVVLKEFLSDNPIVKSLTKGLD
ncbi:AI-2E family transporter [Lutimonas saemankumensis]|uniref:AI-2E family transporter n=1 Tax=Lutimonas saemankumensis TaxID=483016 RepID=UPI001CD63FD4|nr:AI-2E family transporter [Lutimonas saemankumensis]MCA0932042.1 AI-2E family transporter [Lutimonas saemankumensis]